MQNMTIAAAEKLIYFELVRRSWIFEVMAKAIWISASFFFSLRESKSFLSPIFRLQQSSSFLSSELALDFECMKFVIRDKISKIFKNMNYMDHIIWSNQYSCFVSQHWIRSNKKSSIFSISLVKILVARTCISKCAIKIFLKIFRQVNYLR